MKRILAISTLLLLTVSISFGQEKLKTIRANSKSVNIRDGKDFKENSWTISPKINPDIYTTASKGKKVTFYTDRTSVV